VLGGRRLLALPRPSLDEPADLSAPTTRLARRLGTGDAVVLGLGSMLGAGVFVAYGPAADAAGSGLLLGLALAGAVAYCNADASARLAALYPESGGTYVYGRRRLGHFWGFLAGWAFVAGKLASCAAMALTFGAYVAPSLARPLAVAAVVAVVAVNVAGIEKTAAATRAVVAIVLAVLAFTVTAMLVGGDPDPDNLADFHGGAVGVLQAAGFLFFAFAGYARIATLGEEVRDPRRTIPRAIPIALAIALAVYAAVGVAALLAVGPDALARAEAPLREAVPDALGPVVAAGAAVASLGVLLSLVAGIGRTVFAMAANGEFPRPLAAVHPRTRVPHRAEVVVGALVIAAVAAADLREAIGFSSFAVLVYYAIANASAVTLGRRQPLPWLGLAGCLGLAFALPWTSIAAGAGVLAAGAIAYAVSRSYARS
jgi:APA family basic amino acid/polyamine antiporter